MKKVLALVLAMVTSMSLVACGGGADTAGSSDGASGSGEEKTVTLSLAHIQTGRFIRRYCDPRIC